MRKLFCLLSLFLFTTLAGNVKANDFVIPVVSGKVLFSDTIKTSLDKDRIEAGLKEWRKENMQPNDQRFIMGYVNDSIHNVVTYVVFEYMEVEKTSLYVNSIYIKYQLTINYEDNLCIATVGRINYSDNINKLNAEDLISGERVLVDQKYKKVAFSNASQKITAHTVYKVFNIFGSLQKALE